MKTKLSTLKINFNSQLQKEINSSCKEVENNYNIGLINLHEYFIQKADIYKYAAIDAFNIKE